MSEDASVTEQADIKARCQKFMQELGEHFDLTSVRVFVTRPSSDGHGRSMSYTEGIGSYYAQVGHVAEWLLEMEEYTREHVRQEMRD